jgi:hypothetical protein
VLATKEAPQLAEAQERRDEEHPEEREHGNRGHDHGNVTHGSSVPPSIRRRSRMNPYPLHRDWHLYVAPRHVAPQPVRPSEVSGRVTPPIRAERPEAATPDRRASPPIRSETATPR